MAVKLGDRIIEVGRSLWRSCSLAAFQVRMDCSGPFPDELSLMAVTCGNVTALIYLFTLR